MPEYHVGSGFAGIYAGTLKKNGEEWNNKSDVTNEALCAAAQYLLFGGKEFRFEHMGGWYVMRIEELERSEEPKKCDTCKHGGRRMTTLELLNSTAKDRQLWYWRKEIESCHRYMRVYPKGDERRKHWYERYVSAIRTYNELSGMNMKPQEDSE